MSNQRQRTLRFTKSLLIFLVLFLSLVVIAQPKPRIDFDALLKSFPDLPWNFEIRYVTKDGYSTDMLRIYYDGKADAVRWRPEYEGSLASVCRAVIPEGEIKKLLIRMRDSDFNDLPTESESVVAVANKGQQTVSVRLGRTAVQKIDRGNLNSPELNQIQNRLAGMMNGIRPGSALTSCEMESVPVRP